MKLADVTYLLRWLIIHINIFLITLKFMILLYMTHYLDMSHSASK